MPPADPEVRLRIPADLTGADAALGALLQPVTALAGAPSGMEAIQEIGLDVAGTEELDVRTAVLDPATCVELAQRKAAILDGALAANPTERRAFRVAVAALGLAAPSCP